jgi:RNA polymerase sigma-70 factor (ECF subfamily)
MTGESGTDAFLAALDADARARWDADGLPLALVDALARARRAWPRILIDGDAFLAWLAPRVMERAGPSALHVVRIEGLALAFACAQGDAAAIATFEREHGHDIDVALARLHVPSSAVADVRQRVLARLFAGPSAKIASYSGTGELGHWVRTVAARVAVSSRRARAPLDRVVATPSAVPDSPRDPELDWLRRQYQQEFRTAFGAALAGLDDDDRMLLRFKFVDGLTLDDLARLYGIHRATVARRVAAVREDLVRATREQLGGPLRVRRQDLESLVRLVRSDFELSLSRLLATP